MKISEHDEAAVSCLVASHSQNMQTAAGPHSIALRGVCVGNGRANTQVRRAVESLAREQEYL